MVAGSTGVLRVGPELSDIFILQKVVNRTFKGQLYKGHFSLTLERDFCATHEKDMYCNPSLVVITRR